MLRASAANSSNWFVAPSLMVGELYEQRGIGFDRIPALIERNRRDAEARLESDRNSEWLSKSWRKDDEIAYVRPGGDHQGPAHGQSFPGEYHSHQPHRQSRHLAELVNLLRSPGPILLGNAFVDERVAAQVGTSFAPLLSCEINVAAAAALTTIMECTAIYERRMVTWKEAGCFRMIFVTGEY